MKNILIINGPNLNKLNLREKDVYGGITMKGIESECRKIAKTLNLNVEFFQSNSEGDIINKIHKAVEDMDGIIINAAAYTHTSIAIMDSLLMFKKPIIEVHISNLFKREDFRQVSYISLVASGVICGLGVNSYTSAIFAISNMI
jgi:3-dehydroquinate dehydratase-2